MASTELHAFLVADRVYRDPAAGKFVIAGVFRQLEAGDFPAVDPRGAQAFVSLSGVGGQTDASLRYVDVASGEVVMATPDLTIAADDPALIVEFVLDIPVLPMPRPGRFAFELLLRGEVAGRHLIWVQEVVGTSA